MRRLILTAVIVIGFSLVALAAYFLIPRLQTITSVTEKTSYGECVIEVDVPSVSWPQGYDAKVRNSINGEIEKAVVGLLESHLPESAPKNTHIVDAHEALAAWCKNNYRGSDRYFVDVNAVVTQNADGLLSLRIIDSFKVGSGLTATRSTGIIFNTTNGKKLILPDLIKSGRLSAFAEIEHKKLLDVGASYIYEETKQDIALFLNNPTEVGAKDWYAKHGYITTTPDAIVISYNPGDISRSTPDGILEIKILKSELKNILK